MALSREFKIESNTAGAEYAKKQAEEHLASAVKTMKGFVEQMERNIADDAPVSAKIQRVINSMAWGQANAMTSIENAISYNTEMVKCTTIASTLMSVRDGKA